MPAYTSVESVAEKLNVTLDKFRIMQAFGWISITEKNGVEFVRADHEDKGKFILHLQDVF
jgi:hypothetical protein